jgi:hypothetical protein
MVLSCVCLVSWWLYVRFLESVRSCTGELDELHFLSPGLSLVGPEPGGAATKVVVVVVV